MRQTRHIFGIAGGVLLFITPYVPAQAQTQLPSVSTVDLQNVVEYQDDIGDPIKFATNSNVTTASTSRNFGAGAFPGARGTVSGTEGAGRAASMSEDSIGSSDGYDRPGSKMEILARGDYDVRQ